MYGIELEAKKYKHYILTGLHFIEGVMKGSSELYIGIDPGVNFGMTIIEDDKVRIYWGKLPKQTETGMYALMAYNYTEELLNEVYKKFTLQAVPNMAIVEGAAFRQEFGQVGLESVRTGFFLALKHMAFNVKVLQPNTIRKRAFGSGVAMAFNIWPKINHNAADSIGAALAAKYTLWHK